MRQRSWLRSKHSAPIHRELTPDEADLINAITARRDSAVGLRQVLSEDIDGYSDAIEKVRAGEALQILDSQTAGSSRKSINDAIAEFEADRHLTRLALVKVAMNQGLKARQIGEAFGFSRQSAAKYLKEACEEIPEGV